MGKISEMIWRWRRHVELNWIEWGGRHGREGQRHVQVDVYDLSESCQVSKVVAGWWRGRLVTGEWWPLNGKIPRRRVPSRHYVPPFCSLCHCQQGLMNKVKYTPILPIYLLIHAINFIFTFKLLFVDIQ
jgi:hypothetical protein